MLSYLLTAALLLFAFSLGYYLFRRQQPTLPFRRRILLMGILGTILLPLCPSPPVGFTLFADQSPVEQVKAWEAEQLFKAYPQNSTLTIREGESMDEAVAQILEEHNTIWENPAKTLLLFYAIGVLLFLGRTAMGLNRLRKLHRSSRASGEADVRLLAGDGEAFTFGRTIYLSESVYYSADAAVILAHERTHAGERHTFDALLAEAMRAVLWFHPLAWWVRDQVQLNLEYLADAAVLRAGYDKRAYQMSLVAHQQGTDLRTSLLPQFAAKGLKKRINMMAFRAGSPVRSQLFCGGLVFACFATFALTNGEGHVQLPLEASVQHAVSADSTHGEQVLDQLEISDTNQHDYEVKISVVFNQQFDTPHYARGYIEGSLSYILYGLDVNAVDIDVPVRYFKGQDESTEEEFYQILQEQSWNLTFGVRKGGPDDKAIVRLDPM